MNFLVWDENQVEFETDDFSVWLRFMMGDRHIALDYLYKIKISTVFLGRIPGGSDMCYETMVFRTEDELDGWLISLLDIPIRYRTIEQARIGHDYIVDAFLQLFNLVGIIAQKRLTVNQEYNAATCSLPSTSSAA